jgi:hypothetical protein
MITTITFTHHRNNVTHKQQIISQRHVPSMNILNTPLPPFPADQLYLNMSQSSNKILTAFTLITEKIVLARPRSEAKLISPKESRWQILILHYEHAIEDLRGSAPYQMLLGTRDLLKQLMHEYEKLDAADANRIPKIQSVDNWINGSDEVVLAMVNVVVDLDISVRP